jgi:hypothetical protein
MDAALYFEGKICRPVVAVCSNGYNIDSLSLAEMDYANRRVFV